MVNCYFRFTAILFFVFSLFFNHSFAAHPKPLIIEKLLAQTLGSTPLIDNLIELTTAIGGRPTGSVAMEKAVNWGLAKFRDAGLENVHLEKYTPPRNWLAHTETGELVIANNKGVVIRRSLRIAAMPFSLSTPKHGLEAEILDIGRGDEEDFEAVGDKAKGHWLLVMTPLMRGMKDMAEDTGPIFARAKKSGAVGVLWLANRSGRVLYRHSLTFNGSMSNLPAAIIERDEGKNIAKLLTNGQRVKARLVIRNIVQKNPSNYNVVAEITGSEKPDEVIVLGAHLDSWDLGVGALDNGSNVVLALDVGRQIMALANEGYRPRRTIRFILYSGEELALYGSWFDVHNHREELDKIKAVVIYDLGTGRTNGFSLGGRKDMMAAVEQALAPIAALGPFTHTFDANMDTDNFDYLIEGIPTLVANQDEKPYVSSYHAETDTLDKVDRKQLRRNTAIAAVLLWNLSNSEEPLPPRQSPKEILALLKATGLDSDMKDNDVWQDFIKGRRGRHITQ